jgi:hypothetical protein
MLFDNAVPEKCIKSTYLILQYVDEQPHRPLPHLITEDIDSKIFIKHVFKFFLDMVDINIFKKENYLYILTKRAKNLKADINLYYNSAECYYNLQIDEKHIIISYENRAFYKATNDCPFIIGNNEIKAIIDGLQHVLQKAFFFK